MNPRIAFIVAVSFLAGLALGHRMGNSESRLAAVQPAASPTSGPAPGNASPGTSSTASEPGASPTPGQPLTTSESQAVGGLLALRGGDYAAAIPLLDAAASGIDAPELTAFRATAREGAGRSREAEEILKSDAEIEAVRAIARDAFMQHQDFMIAGPAYQLYLRLRPNAAQAPMMKQAIEMWGRKQRGEALN